MKTLLLVICLLLTNYCFAQNTYEIRADTVRIYNTCDTAELVLENRTKDSLGFLFNKGKGRTEFRRLQLEKIGTSQLAITGQDTVDMKLLSDTGRIGIGTAMPLEKLHISDTSTVMYTTSSASLTGPVGPSFLVQNASSVFNVGAFTKYKLKNGAGRDFNAYIGAIVVGGPSSAPTPAIVFGRSTSANSYSESMRITETGGLYINMSNYPANPKLGVKGNAYVDGTMSITGPTTIDGSLGVGGALFTKTRIVNTDSDVTIDNTDYTVLLETPNAGTTQSLTLPPPNSAASVIGRVLVLIENSSDIWNLNFTVKYPGGTNFTVLPANTTTILQDLNGSWYKIK